METTMTNGAIYAATKPMDQLLQEKLPVRTAFKLARVAKALGDAVEPIEATRMSLLRKYRDSKVKGQLIVNPNSEEYEKFMEEMDVLFTETTTFEFEGPVALPDLVASTCDKCHHNNNRPLQIEPGILMALAKFVTANED